MSQYWLMKSEPEVYSIDQLQRDSTTWWEGVRNYQARNFMAQKMVPGDLVLFYHSNATPSGVAGVAKVSLTAAPDPSQFQKNSDYFDPKSTPEKPIWFCVQVEFVKKFSNIISLESLRSHPELNEMLLLKKGQRLSVQPVTEKEFNFILNLDFIEK